jgi:hypothetical protein
MMGVSAREVERMKRRDVFAWFGVMVLASFVIACGDAGDAASISGVIPGALFVGRDADILIIGSNTGWTSGVRVDLGEGIEVREVVAASPTALLVKASAEPGAELGPRDITVEDLDFAGGVDVRSPVALTYQGLIAQGSISVIELQNLDFAHPFDTTSVGGGLFEPLRFTNVRATAGEGTTLQVSQVEPYRMRLLLLSDVGASGGAHDLDVQSGPSGEEVGFRLPAAFDLIERAPTALASGQPAVGSMERPFQAWLFSIVPDELSVVRAATFAMAPNAVPGIAVLPASGSFADVITFDLSTTLISDEVHYLVYWDNSGASGYQFQVSASTTTVAERAEEVEPNDVRTEAAAVALTPAVIADSTIPSQDDVDWVEVELTAEQVGEGVRLRAMSYGDDPQTDTALAIFRGDEVDPLISSDVVRLDEVTANITEPGIYYVRVSASTSSFYDAEHSAYSLAILLE